MNNQQTRAILVPDIDDASYVSINPKLRLIAVGRKNSHMSVFTIDDLTGGLELSYTNILKSKDFPGNPGKISRIKWSPDGNVVAVVWQQGTVGSFSLWSCFGSLLMCSLAWDYGIASSKCFYINSLDWSCEGYHLLLILNEENSNRTKLLQQDFIKSALSVNPCVSLSPYLLLQGDDKILINNSDTLETIYENIQTKDINISSNDCDEFEIKAIQSSKFLSASKLWNTILVPTSYMNANWPIRYSVLDQSGSNLAVAGKTGIALFSLLQNKWKLFGSESQEKDFMVTGGILWWNKFVIVCNYNLSAQNDEIRIYPRDQKLDNKFVSIFTMSTPVMMSNIFKDKLVIFAADSRIMIFSMSTDSKDCFQHLNLLCIYDIRNICLHPAFVVSISLTNFKNDGSIQSGADTETIFLNVAGRVLMIQKDKNDKALQFSTTCLASCVECIWFSSSFPEHSKNIHLQESLWFYGSHGMRVWLPVKHIEDQHTHKHSFMSKRIMLIFSLRIYPLAISFEDAIIFGVENDTVIYLNDQTSHFSLPFNRIKRTSQVYLHQILKQLIRRNLGFNAWEIARNCSALPYFPHSMELLLHEVLEQEATSKDPIPDALLPSVVEFIKEFPCYLQTIVNTARKTEIALWPYLFNAAGKPRELFKQCLTNNQLYSATNYLIILQNFESSTISKQCTLVLLDAALEQKNWTLSQELVRFLKAIEPNDSESLNSSTQVKNKAMQMQLLHPVITSIEELNLIFPKPTTSSLPSSLQKKKLITESETSSQKLVSNDEINKSDQSLFEDYLDDQSIDPIISKHFKKHLQNLELMSLGYMSAALDFELVAWISKEKKLDAELSIDNFVEAINKLHTYLKLCKPYSTLESLKYGQFGVNFPPSSEESVKYKSLDSGFESAKLDSIVKRANNDNESIISNTNMIYDEINENYMNDETQLPVSHTSDEQIKIQLRYLLQIFFEADCLDFALLLSVFLFDKTSVTRIVNRVINTSSSLKLCLQLKSGLQKLTTWSINECLGYRDFMVNCDEEITKLENHIELYNLTSKTECTKEVTYKSKFINKMPTKVSINELKPSAKVTVSSTSTILTPNHDSRNLFFNQEETLDMSKQNSGNSLSCSIM